jgi:peptidyl-dipeptidase A
VPPGTPPPTVDEARAFLAAIDRDIRPLLLASNRAEFESGVENTPANWQAARAAKAKFSEFVIDRVRASRRFDAIELPPDVARQIDSLRRMEAPTPKNPESATALNRAKSTMEETYGKAKPCIAPGACKFLDDLQAILRQSRNPEELRLAWVAWHDATTPLRAPFSEYVRLANEAAKDFGAEDYGRYAKQDYDSASFERDIDGVWRELRPLYEQLHCYARMKLRAKYGDIVPARGPIPAHLLGDMWAQNWSALGDVLGLKGAPSSERTSLEQKEIVRAAEGYFTSMGFDPLPASFWERSVFVKSGRDMVCRVSAWDVGFRGDVRLRGCLGTTIADVVTAHHEMAHLYYYQSYVNLPVLLQAGPNEAFHEGLATAIELAMTPAYLREIGATTASSGDVAETLLRRALDDVAFMPFGLVVDKWRWNVLGGEIPPSRYNASWWALRQQYQGIAPPAARGEATFDPGAKYHIAADVTYIRYFVARILSFQIHRALCRASGQKEVATCSLRKSKEAGAKLRAAMSLGASKPSPEVLAALGAEPRLDASAMLEFYAPLRSRLEKELKGQTCGW